MNNWKQSWTGLLNCDFFSSKFNFNGLFKLWETLDHKYPPHMEIVTSFFYLFTAHNHTRTKIIPISTETTSIGYRFSLLPVVELYPPFTVVFIALMLSKSILALINNQPILFLGYNQWHKCWSMSPSMGSYWVNSRYTGFQAVKLVDIELVSRISVSSDSHIDLRRLFRS